MNVYIHTCTHLSPIRIWINVYICKDEYVYIDECVYTYMHTPITHWYIDECVAGLRFDLVGDMTDL